MYNKSLVHYLNACYYIHAKGHQSLQRPYILIIECKILMCPPYPQCVVKGNYISRYNRIKRVAPGRVGDWTGTLKNPSKCLWLWEPDRRSNFFFSPPAHLCAVTYMTDISFIVTLIKQPIHLNLIEPQCFPELIILNDVSNGYQLTSV